MRYDVEVGGRSCQVSVTRTGAAFAVTVDGHTWHVDAARIDANILSLVLDKVWSKETVVVPDPATGQLTVGVDGVPVTVRLNGRVRATERGRALRGGGGGGAGSGSDGVERQERLTAPMPGKILRVMARPGEAVKSRQPLLVVEAMKMENELRASRDGIVAEVHATEGQSVDAGALLIVIQ